MGWRNARKAVRVVAAAAALAVSGLLVTACADDSAGRPTPPPTGSTNGPAASEAPGAPDTRGMRYVALGDSYSAGMGGGGEAGLCNRSPHAFPHQLAASAGLDLVAFPACAGATTTDVIHDQLGALNSRTQLVTLTIGGNDLDVSALPTACAQGETTVCKAAVSRSVSLLGSLPAKLAAVYGAVARAAPHARILVADYPAFYDLPTLDPATLGSPQVSAAIAVDTAVSSLDATIADAVAKARTKGIDIHFVDVSFVGHGIGSGTPWFVLQGPDIFHPTAGGYTRYASALRAALV
jgi:lysophospholipase L1-like esterase